MDRLNVAAPRATHSHNACAHNQRPRVHAGWIGLALALGLSTATAAVLPPAVQTALDQRMTSYTQASGFTSVDADSLTDGDWHDAKRFPRYPSSAMSLPDADLHPVTKAILLLESREPALPHTRYRVNYRLEVADGDYPEFQQAYVEVTRFNLGPARHADTVENYGEHAAPLETFGVGPHVTWRFVTSSTMGMRADVLAASRKTVDARAAAAADCLGVKCLALPDPQGPSDSWQPLSTEVANRSVVFADRQGELPNAARLADDLLAQVVPDGEDPSMPGPNQPSMTAVLSINVDGQDDNVSALLLQDHLQDDSAAQIWTRRQAIGDISEWSQHVVHRRGGL